MRESVREREFYRYCTPDVFPIAASISSSSGDNTSLRPCRDPTLTALAQLGALRLNCGHAFISLFNNTHQFVLAEATPSLSLLSADAQADGHGLWIGTATLPRSESGCVYALEEQDEALTRSEDASQTPITLVVPNMRDDERFASLPHVKNAPFAQFFAAAPILSAKGIPIGVYSVMDSQPKTGLDDSYLHFLRDISITVANYLESVRAKQDRSRGERMVRGLGSFVEGMATIRSTTHLAMLRSGDNEEGRLNETQQDKQEAIDVQSAKDAASQRLPRAPVQPPIHRALSTLSAFSTSTGITTPAVHQHILSRAANIIRESIEVEGAAFFDASISSFGGLVGSTDLSEDSESSDASANPRSSSDVDPLQENAHESTAEDQPHVDPAKDHESICKVLGYSTSLSSSINDDKSRDTFPKVTESFLKRLLRRYPHGKVFNFYESGDFISSESETETHGAPPQGQGTTARPYLERKSKTGRGSERQKVDAKALCGAIPGARSVAFVPLWDSHKERWFSGGIIWTNNPLRALTVEAEFSYLQAFGSSVMTEITRVEELAANHAKENVLSSISHELRSPLHGILGSVEMLRDTVYDAFQDSTLMSIEMCGRTLLDTLDQLLDFAKVNNFVSESKKNKKSKARKGGMRNAIDLGSAKGSVRSGMMSLSSDAEIDRLVEEVVDTVCLGFSSYQTVADLSSESGPGLRLQKFDVQVMLDIDNNLEWEFYTETGAFRRLILNLFGNAMKYTQKGYIRVSLTQRISSSNKDGFTEVVFQVEDTGQGISDHFLRNGLYTPFSQENSIGEGLGLGLSITKQIVESLGGQINIQSEQGTGTQATIVMPMKRARRHSAPGGSDTKRKAVLRDLRVSFAGFDESYGITTPISEYADENTATSVPLTNLLPIKSSLEAICKHKFGMRVEEDIEKNADATEPDIRISCIGKANDLIEQYHKAVSSKDEDDHSPGKPRLCPVVVICDSALSAKHLFEKVGKSRHGRMFQVIFQPCGPQKLATAFEACLRNDASDVHRDMDSLTPDMPSHRALADATEKEPPKQPSGPVQPPISSHSTVEERESIVKQVEPGPTHVGEGIIARLPDQSARDLYLLVDDNAINLQILVAFMRKRKYSYKAAQNGFEAFNTYKESNGRIACILLDLSMPVMDGFAASRHIRAYEHENNFKPSIIIALTGLAAASAQKEAYASGIDLFLTKPVRLKELEGLIKQIPGKEGEREENGQQKNESSAGPTS